MTSQTSSKTSSLGDASVALGAELGLAFTSEVQGLVFFNFSKAKDEPIETQVSQMGLGFDWGFRLF